MAGVRSVLRPDANSNNPKMNKLTAEPATETVTLTLKGVNFKPKHIQRFFERMTKDGPIPERYPELGNCWDWKGVIERTGYGSMAIWHTGFLAHRVSYGIHFGQFDESLCVLHRCDRRCCCNPAHLFLGTKGDNIRDCAAKGRTAKGDRNGRRLHPESIPRGENHPLRKNPELAARGEDCGASRLTAEQVLEIRAVADPKKRNFSKLGRTYGISSTAVGFIYYRKTWTHI